MTNYHYHGRHHTIPLNYRPIHLTIDPIITLITISHYHHLIPTISHAAWSETIYLSAAHYQ